MPSGMTDEELLAGVQSGAPQAFRMLVEQHMRKVLNICYRFAGDRMDAEDLAQETFVEVHRSIRDFRGECSLSTWVYRIAVSKSLDFLRRSRRQKRKAETELLRFDSDVAEMPGPSSETPEAQLEQKERVRILQSALDSLPKNQRVAFVLSKYDGMSYQEVAALLKTTVPSVESLIHRAKMSLQKKLHKYYRNCQ